MTRNPTITTKPPPPATTGEVSILKNMDFSIYDEPDSTRLKEIGWNVIDNSC